MCTTLEAATRAGVSLRQADYWSRTGLIDSEGANGCGTRRVFDEHEVELMRVLGLLARALGGTYRPVAEAVLQELRPLPLSWWPEELRVEVGDGVTLVVQARRGGP